MSAPTPTGPQAQEAALTDLLAQEIRRVDGNHSLGASALAEALTPFITGLTPARVVSDSGLFSTLRELVDASAELAEARLPCDQVKDENFTRTVEAHRRHKAAMKAALSTLQSGAEGKDGDALDAERYRYLRSLSSRDHGHHTRRAFHAGQVDWVHNLNPNNIVGVCNMWGQSELTGPDLDAAIDTALQPGQEG